MATNSDYYAFNLILMKTAFIWEQVQGTYRYQIKYKGMQYTFTLMKTNKKMDLLY